MCNLLIYTYKQISDFGFNMCNSREREVSLVVDYTNELVMLKWIIKDVSQEYFDDDETSI